MNCVYKYGSFIFETHRSTICLCTLRNYNIGIYFDYGDGLLAAALYGYLVCLGRHTHAARGEKEKQSEVCLLYQALRKDSYNISVKQRNCS